MPQTLSARQNKVDANIAARWDSLVLMQDGYASTRGGRFFQGISTHDTPVTDGDARQPNMDRKPTDQAETWRAVGAAPLFPPDMDASIAIDVYEGPLGWGWIVRAEMEHESVVYAKAWANGPETWRAHGWQEVTSE